MIAGIACILAVLLDAFQTIILPRRATGRFRLTRLFYIVTWRPWVFRAQAAQFPQAGDGLQLVRAAIADSAAGGVGGRHGGGLRARFLFPRQPVQRRSRSRDFPIGPLRERDHLFTLGLGDVTPQRAGRVTRDPGIGNRAGISGRRHGVFPGAVRRVFAPRSEHFAAGCASRLAANRRGADAPPFHKGAETRSRCCWRSGSAGRRSCWRAISRIRCCVISARSTTIRAGSAR